MKRFSGKAAVVTGGSSGIGKAIAQRYAKEGGKVIIMGRKEAVLQEMAAIDENINYVAGDITQDAAMEKVINTARKTFGRLNVLVNCDGWCPMQPITKITMADYDRPLIWTCGRW